MYNPYTILTPEILSAMLKQPMYFVRQFYQRGLPFENEKIIPLLLTHYSHHDTDKERAERHIRLLHHDRYRFLYNSANTAHAEKLIKASLQPQGYRVYINLLPKKWKANDALKMKIGRYVSAKLPWWNYTPKDKLNVTLKERYGELFITLLWRGQQTEVLLDDIENFSLCATT
jgi:hypothetical protein